MTTKKSKPASLTSSLLARKGEAEPAAAPYSIPESGRQRPAESLAGKGNGNDNGDLGHALTGMARLPGGSEPRAVAAEGAPSGPAEPAELPVARVVPAPVQAAVSPPDSEPVESESAIAKEAVATKSAAPAGERAAAAQMSAAAGAEASTGGGAGSEGGEAEREAARDARLLRFVYVMAALTGIVAIVLYAGGWLRDGPKQPAPEVVASAPAPSASSDPATKDAASPGPAPEAGAPAVPEPAVEAQGIPPAPPVVPPAVVETKPSVPEAPVTTGGPAKHQPESLASMPAAGPETPAATSQPGTQPTIPAPSDAQAGSSQTGSSQAGSSMAKAPSPGNAGPGAPPSASAGAASSPESPAAAVTAPKSVGPNENVASAASNKPVRDVPNLRVLAPALMKPEPVESAPPPVKPSTNAAAPSPSSVPTVTVPQEVRTASVPKTAPAEPPKTAAADGGFRVQLASVTSEKRAEREWARLQKAFPDVLGGLKLTIEKKDIAGRGTFYRVQTGGYATLDEARSVCNGLKEKKQACLPVNR